MIKSFRHDGLARFFQTGSKAGIRPEHAKRLNVQLGRLDGATCPEDMNMPGWRFHRLLGELAIRLAAALGGSAESRLNMQTAYDLWHAEKNRRTSGRYKAKPKPTAIMPLLLRRAFAQLRPPPTAGPMLRAQSGPQREPPMALICTGRRTPSLHWPACFLTWASRRYK